MQSPKQYEVLAFSSFDDEIDSKDLIYNKMHPMPPTQSERDFVVSVLASKVDYAYLREGDTSTLLGVANMLYHALHNTLEYLCVIVILDGPDILSTWVYNPKESEGEAWLKKL
jgi:hypothetical protein